MERERKEKKEYKKTQERGDSLSRESQFGRKIFWIFKNWIETLFSREMLYFIEILEYPLNTRVERGTRMNLYKSPMNSFD